MVKLLLLLFFIMVEWASICLLLLIGVYWSGKEYMNKINDRVYRNTLNKVKDKLGKNVALVGKNLSKVGKNLGKVSKNISKVKGFKIRRK